MTDQQICTACGADVVEVQHRVQKADGTFWHRSEWQHVQGGTPANDECESGATAATTS